jgi:hypothetical protein
MQMDLSERIVGFRNAFPSMIRPHVATLACLPHSELPPSPNDIGPVVINGEQLRIPYRFYAREPESSCLQLLDDHQRLILNAIYTRHANGYIREQHVRPLLLADELWIPPFVIQLLGEYVLEIIQVLEDHIAVFLGPSYVRFARENRAFLQLLRRRITSYWNCYYRNRFQRLNDYPAFKIVEVIEGAG